MKNEDEIGLMAFRNEATIEDLNEHIDKLREILDKPKKKGSE